MRDWREPERVKQDEILHIWQKETRFEEQDLVFFFSSFSFFGFTLFL